MSLVQGKYCKKGFLCSLCAVLGLQGIKCTAAISKRTSAYDRSDSFKLVLKTLRLSLEQIKYEEKRVHDYSCFLAHVHGMT